MALKEVNSNRLHTAPLYPFFAQGTLGRTDSETGELIFIQHLKNQGVTALEVKAFKLCSSWFLAARGALISAVCWIGAEEKTNKQTNVKRETRQE